MKHNFTFALSILISSLFLSCNKDNGCQSNFTSDSKTAKLFDYNSNSPHYDQVVAIFKLTDNTTSFSPANSHSVCKTNDECKISLTIQNKITQQITMNYRVQAASIVGSIDYRGIITIPANGTVDVGQISTQCIYIYYSSFSVESSDITYL